MFDSETIYARSCKIKFAYSQNVSNEVRYFQLRMQQKTFSRRETLSSKIFFKMPRLNMHDLVWTIIFNCPDLDGTPQIPRN